MVLLTGTIENHSQKIIGNLFERTNLTYSLKPGVRHIDTAFGEWYQKEYNATRVKGF